jgi:hypothetical protein
MAFGLNMLNKIKTKQMKIKFQYIWLPALVISLAACKKDNYSAPSSTLNGKIQYQGEAIQVEYNKVSFELYQYGFGRVGAIGASFSQDGTYSALLFDGDYKLIIPNGQGPFKWPQTSAGKPDSIAISLKGNKTLDLDVIPYYMIRTPKFAAASGKVTASFKIDKIVTDATAKDIEVVTLYINKTQFVSGDFNNARTSIVGSAIVDPNNINLEVNIPAMVPEQNYIFARIGLKIAGVEDRIFSPVEKLTF